MLFWRERWSLRQDFTAPDFISCFYLDLEGVACGLSCLHSITPAMVGELACCWAMFNIPCRSWRQMCFKGSVGMPFPTHSLNGSCCEDGLVGAEAVMKWKRSHASRRVGLGGESCSKTPTKIPIFYICFLLESVSWRGVYPVLLSIEPLVGLFLILTHFNKDDPVCSNSYELILTRKTL